MYQGNFKKDKIHSPNEKSHIFYDNGKVEYEGKILIGAYSDHGIIYNKNGKPKMKGKFVQGK